LEGQVDINDSVVSAGGAFKATLTAFELLKGTRQISADNFIAMMCEQGK
jgi:hypothetical protein